MMSTRMKVFGEHEGVRLILQAEERDKTAYVDIVLDVPNTENLIDMLKQGIAVHKGIKALTFKTPAEA
jgi:hypothetical protein